MRASAVLLALIFSVFLVSFVHGEQTGTLNLTTAGSTYGTGLIGKTVAYCNATADCLDSTNYRCLIDYDSQSISDSFTGWCAPASQTSCAHNNAAAAGYENTTTGNKFCVNSTAYRTCTSGNWSANVTLCASGETCQDGACKAASSSSSSGGAGTTTTAASFIRIAAYPSEFNVTQGDNVSKTVNVTNGNTTQKNITVALSGLNLAWYVVSDKIAVLSAKANASFAVNFSIPTSAEVKTYSATITASTSNASVIDSVNFTMRVLPSNQTIQQQLKPALGNYSGQLAALESRLAQEKANFSETKQKKIENLIEFAKTRLASAKNLSEQGKYFESNSEAQEVQGLINDIKAAFDEKEPLPEKAEDFTLVLVLVVIVAIAVVFIAFVLWPTKEAGYSKERGWLHPEEKKRVLDRFKNKFKKKKKQEESYFYGYKKGE